MVKTVTGATTAISRKAPPEPLRWLSRSNLLKGRTLDYGSGRQCWYNMVCYDPYWRSSKPTGKFDTVVCIYVLNVVPSTTQTTVINQVRRLLKVGGTAYFAVRRDIPRTGIQGRGTMQRFVTLNLPSVRRTSGYEIYALRNSK